MLPETLLGLGTGTTARKSGSARGWGAVKIFRFLGKRRVGARGLQSLRGIGESFVGRTPDSAQCCSLYLGDRQCYKRSPHLVTPVSWVVVGRTFGVRELAPALQGRQLAGGAHAGDCWLFGEYQVPSLNVKVVTTSIQSGSKLALRWDECDPESGSKLPHSKMSKLKTAVTDRRYSGQHFEAGPFEDVTMNCRN